ncbi:MAG: RCC1 domain-containing protein, partial [Candidatus Poseidoniaceae archaeon]
MASHSKLWVALFLSLLMIGLAQTSYVTVDEEIIETFSQSDETISKSSPMNLSSGYNPKTFVDDAIFFDSVRAESVSIGFRSSCIVYDDQSLTCTGYNYQGLLGAGFATTASPYLEKEHIKINFPEPVKVSQVEAGYDSTCAIDTDGGLWCWGYNNHGKSGTGSPESYIMSPERVLIDENESVSEVAVGNNHKCALTDSKKIYCWGNNNYGQSLLPHSGSVNIPTEVNLDSGIVPVSISGKQEHTCIINQNGAVY